MKSMCRTSVIHWVLGLCAGLLVQSTGAVADPFSAIVGSSSPTAVVNLTAMAVENPNLADLAQLYRAPAIGPNNCQPGYVYRVMPDSNHQRNVASSGTCIRSNCNTIANTSNGNAECAVTVNTNYNVNVNPTALNAYHY